MVEFLLDIVFEFCWFLIGEMLHWRGRWWLAVLALALVALANLVLILAFS